MATFRWEVHPYTWLGDLTLNYTKTVMVATTAKAYQRAKEGTRWMRMNAKWKDTTYKKGPNQKVKTPPGHARDDLRVVVMFDENMTTEQRQLYREAKKRDRKKLSKINFQRRGTGQRRLTKLPANVPSEASAFEKELAQEQIPIVSLRFEYNDRGPSLTYARWLEIANQGRFSIIGPAIDHFSPKLMADLRSIARRKSLPGITIGEQFDPEVPVIEKPWTPQRKENRAVRRIRRENYKNRLEAEDRRNIQIGQELNAKDAAQAYQEYRKKRGLVDAPTSTFKLR